MATFHSTKESSPSARMAMFYITFGALTIVWTGVWFLYLKRSGPVKDVTWLWCLGFFLTGLTFLGIGLTVGHIGRSARQADNLNVPVATPAPLPNQNVVATPPAEVLTPANGAAPTRMV